MRIVEAIKPAEMIHH